MCVCVQCRGNNNIRCCANLFFYEYHIIIVLRHVRTGFGLVVATARPPHVCNNNNRVRLWLSSPRVYRGILRVEVPTCRPRVIEVRDVPDRASTRVGLPRYKRHTRDVPSNPFSVRLARLRVMSCGQIALRPYNIRRVTTIRRAYRSRKTVIVIRLGPSRLHKYVLHYCALLQFSANVTHDVVITVRLPKYIILLYYNTVYGPVVTAQRPRYSTHKLTLDISVGSISRDTHNNIASGSASRFRFLHIAHEVCYHYAISRKFLHLKIRVFSVFF